MFADTQEQLYHGHLVTGHPCAFQDSQYIISFCLLQFTTNHKRVQAFSLTFRIRRVCCHSNKNRAAMHSDLMCNRVMARYYKMLQAYTTYKIGRAFFFNKDLGYFENTFDLCKWPVCKYLGRVVKRRFSYKLF